MSPHSGGRLRILLLTSGYPPIVGGAETYAATLATGLAGLGHDVLVVTDDVDAEAPDSGGPEDEGAGTGRPRIRRLRGYRTLLADPSKLRWEQMMFGLLPELLTLTAAWHPDVVVANSLETTVSGRVVAHEYGIPLVGAYHEHSPEDEPFGQGKMALGYRHLAPDAVIAGSLMYRDRALSFLDRNRVHLIHHGVDTARFSPARDGSRMRARYGLGAKESLVVSAGRLKERKGHRELIEAFARTARPATHLVIAGSVSSASLDYSAGLESLLDRLDLRGRARIDQGVQPAEVPELFAAADVVVQPSHSEGLGLALLEAMSTARACVASRIVGHDEILSVAGQVAHPAPDALVEPVEPHDVDGLAGALERLLCDGARRAALGAAARSHVERYFSQQVMLERTEALLHAVAARAPGGTR